ncbi:hypothetical protein RR48_11059 [Papilio machaon]|uniref:Uncharacterized protein n=1 Tax=Papilio machaon TaxID=76193 RepID=A0A194RPJ6_PAPMA|nr:hypothetical protein RR48_11059 [Papilio machaon]
MRQLSVLLVTVPEDTLAIPHNNPDTPDTPHTLSHGERNLIKDGLQHIGAALLLLLHPVLVLRLWRPSAAHRRTPRGASAPTTYHHCQPTTTTIQIVTYNKGQCCSCCCDDGGGVNVVQQPNEGGWGGGPPSVMVVDDAPGPMGR